MVLEKERKMVMKRGERKEKQENAMGKDDKEVMRRAERETRMKGKEEGKDEYKMRNRDGGL